LRLKNPESIPLMPPLASATLISPNALGRVYCSTMKITLSLFEAFLKCPTKCWLRFTREPPAGYPYAEWVQTENESYRHRIRQTIAGNLAGG